MNKVKQILIIVVTFIIIYLLNQYLFFYIPIFNAIPNLFLIAVVIIGIYFGELKGLIIGATYGLVIDVLNSSYIGVTVFSLGLIGYLAGVLVRIYFSKESKITILIMITAFTVLYECIQYILKIIIFSTEIEIIALLKIILAEIIYNVLLSIIIYPFYQKLLSKENKSKRFLNYFI